MYCPQCGNANEDDAAFCVKCGLDLQKYRQQWSNTAGGTGDPAAAGQEPQGDQQPVAPPSAYPPPYPQQPQPTYQNPPYEPAANYPPPGDYQPPGYQPGYPQGVIPKIPSYMGWAIATLILCFWPTGIVAVVYASKVGNRLVLGDIAGAQEASHKAKMWTWITFGIWVVGAVIAIIIAVVAAATAVNSLTIQ
jgi:hypothetical protein